MKNLITLCLLLMTLVSCSDKYVEPIEIIQEPVYNTLYVLDSYYKTDIDFQTNLFFKSDTSELYQINDNWGPIYQLFRRDYSIENIPETDSCFFRTVFGMKKALKINNYTALLDGEYKIDNTTDLQKDYLNYQNIKTRSAILRSLQDQIIVISEGSLYSTSNSITNVKNQQFCFEFTLKVNRIYNDYSAQITLIKNRKAKNTFTVSLSPYSSSFTPLIKYNPLYIGEIQFIKQ